MCQSVFFNKVAAWPATLLKKRPWHRCFPVNFPKFQRTPLLINPSGGCSGISKHGSTKESKIEIIVPT